MAEERERERMRKTIPHFWNLNEDPALTGVVLHFCKKGIILIQVDIRD